MKHKTTEVTVKDKIKKIFAQDNVKGITFNSNEVENQNAFFAVRGNTSDGNLYIGQAFARGAVVVFTDDKEQLKKYPDANIVIVDDVRLAISVAAGVLYPKLPQKLVAVTGTNGKSSVVSYCFQILSHLGIAAASLGTIGVEVTSDIKKVKITSADNELTMADPITFRRNLHQLADAGVQIVAFEVSSHGLEQKRMGDIKVDAAGFTSFSQDHLDYHGSMEKYLDAKLKLFRHNIKQEGIAVVPNNIAERNVIFKCLEELELSINILGSSDIKISSNALGMLGQHIGISRHNKAYELNTEIIGSFQSDNLLMAAELVAATTNAPYDEIISALSSVKSVKGRLERVTDLSTEYQVFVDYAHTPDSLQKSLQELMNLLKDDGELYVIFGCGGDRDVGKRAVMGQIAARHADNIVITDDNPRSENAANIREQIIGGANSVIKNTNSPSKLAQIIEIANRKNAIESTIDLLKKNDILLIAGKGHEEYQIIGAVKHVFSDIKTAKQYLTLKLAS